MMLLVPAAQGKGRGPVRPTSGAGYGHLIVGRFGMWRGTGQDHHYFTGAVWCLCHRSAEPVLLNTKYTGRRRALGGSGDAARTTRWRPPGRVWQAAQARRCAVVVETASGAPGRLRPPGGASGKTARRVAADPEMSPSGARTGTRPTVAGMPGERTPFPRRGLPRCGLPRGREKDSPPGHRTASTTRQHLAYVKGVRHRIRWRRGNPLAEAPLSRLLARRRLPRASQAPPDGQDTGAPVQRDAGPPGEPGSPDRSVGL